MIHSMSRIVTDRMSPLLESHLARMIASVKIVKNNRNSDLTTAKGPFVHKSKHMKIILKQITFQQEEMDAKKCNRKICRQHQKHCIIIAKSLVLANSSTASQMLCSMLIVSTKVKRASL